MVAHENKSTGFKASADTRIRTVTKIQWEKSQASLGQNAKRGVYPWNPVSGPNREFRIVKDNRMNQKGNCDAKAESLQNLSSGGKSMMLSVPEKSSTGILTDQKQSAATSSEEQMVAQGLSGGHDSGPGHAKYVKSTSNVGQPLHEGMQVMASNSTTVVQRRVENDSQVLLPTLASTNSVIGMSSSSSDPVHVPSPDSRSAGTVGAIRREVGVVGGRRQLSDRPAIKSSFSNSSSSVPLLKDDASSTAFSGHIVTTSKSTQYIQSSSLEPIVPSVSISRSISSGQSNGKLHHLPASQQKVTQPTMEWKPKPSPKPSIVSHGIGGTTAAPSCADVSTGSNRAKLPGLSEKLSQVNFFGDGHVIMPQHLQVPKSEWTRLIFGSFGSGVDSTKGFSSALQAQGNAEESNDEPSASLSISVPVGSSEDASAAKTDLGDSPIGTSRTHSPATAEDKPLPVDKETLGSPQKSIDSYADIGLVQSNSPSYGSSEPQLQNNPSLPSFTAYDPQTRYDLPFFRAAIEDTVGGQDIASAAEVHSSHPSNSSQMSAVTTAQQQQSIQQQQQPVAQLYPSVHISHFPNFMPYRHVFSPVYVPPMAMPNYSSNAAYAHPPNGSNYLVVPGGNSHITANGMKYAASQYKAVPAGSPNGYGNYANPSGFIGAPGTVGSTSGLDEASRTKYKDNSSYVPNPQAETSDIWIQTPRELPNLQSAPFYNLSGQAAAPHAAFVPTHTGHASFNAAAAAAAAQTSHVQYPGMYHSPQPASIASPHPLVHQQVQPALGGNVGVGMAAPGAQVGTYQQPQLSHLGWTANF